jgi:hypothetical protein
MNENRDVLYFEKVSSRKTVGIFIGLTSVFLLLFFWQIKVYGWNGLAIAFLVFSCIFLFYVANYRTLIISITSVSVKLSFGIFKWSVPFDNIETCELDEIPPFMKYGGAGIHFMTIRNRYRASFNFLEYPRVVIGFKNKVGPVRDISFSTRQPEDILRIIKNAIAV